MKDSVLSMRAVPKASSETVGPSSATDPDLLEGLRTDVTDKKRYIPISVHREYRLSFYT